MAGGFEVLSAVAAANARALELGGGEEQPIGQDWIPAWLWNVLPPAEGAE